LRRYNCNLFKCTGVIEFIGTQERIGSHTQYFHRLREEEFIESLEPKILVYKCSRCGDLHLKMNEACNQEIKRAQNMFYQKEVIV
jgi:uncharacterized OB-fold protein